MRAVPLGSVVTSLGGGTPSKSNPDYFGGEIPWVTPKDMKFAELFDSQIRITDAGLANSAARLVPADSVLVVTRSGVLKHTLPVALNRVPVAINQDLRALVPSSHVNPGYLAHLLRAEARVVLQWVRATTADNFPFQRLLDLEIPLPSLDEQRRIARMLDAADALRAKRREAIACIDSLSPALFVDMFGDPATNPRGWTMGRVGDLVESAHYGTSKKAGGDGRLPVLRMGNLTADGRIDMTSLKYMDLAPDEEARYTTRAGDILFNRTNSPDLVGKTALFRGGHPVAFAGYLIRIRMKPQHEPEYLSSFLNTVYAKRVLRGMCKAIVGMANINAKELQTIKIPVVPSDLQQKFARSVTRIERERARPVSQLAHLDALFASLRSRAFTGEL